MPTKAEYWEEKWNRVSDVKGELASKWLNQLDKIVDIAHKITVDVRDADKTQTEKFNKLIKLIREFVEIDRFSKSVRNKMQSVGEKWDEAEREEQRPNPVRKGNKRRGEFEVVPFLLKGEWRKLYQLYEILHSRYSKNQIRFFGEEEHGWLRIWVDDSSIVDDVKSEIAKSGVRIDPDEPIV